MQKVVVFWWSGDVCDESEEVIRERSGCEASEIACEAAVAHVWRLMIAKVLIFLVCCWLDMICLSLVAKALWTIMLVCEVCVVFDAA